MDRRQAMRARLAAHGLVSRDSDLLTAAGRVGVQETPPGSAAQAFSLRVPDLTPDDLRDLVRLWSMRGAPHVMPVADAAVFTEGLRPDDEASCRHFIRGAWDHLDRFGLSAGRRTRGRVAVYSAGENRCHRARTPGRNWSGGFSGVRPSLVGSPRCETVRSGL
ncbi:DNA glycosylase AlkZ-like family protein [Amycolatopsis sp. YIM 10]|uniref:DNA glycosylase AlkZ-like family protein n=1 Tax=Amycolatopsis sp. YIM 10 TaxID=2653857 RepID=UPI0012901D5F